MKQDEFMREQYVTLREEIRDTKDRIFKILGIGLFIVPAGQYLARALDAQLILLVIPILVYSVGLLYLSENHALMRCGRYIRRYVEPKVFDVKADSNNLGWEQWLETSDPSEPRNVDRFVSYAIYLVLGIYYILSVIMAYNYSNKNYGDVVSTILIGIYTVIGGIGIFLLVKTARLTTTTKTDTL